METLPLPCFTAASEILCPSQFITLADGSTFIPIGPNLCFPRFVTDEAEGLAVYKTWIQQLATNGANFVRIWLGHPFFDLETERCGLFSQERAARLRQVLDLAAQHNLRVKITLDHFRFIDPQCVAEIFPGAARFDRPILHRDLGGVATNMSDYLGGAEGRSHFLAKLDFLALHFYDHSAIFAWELWNEMNAVKANNWQDWTAFLLPELAQRFPNVLTLQSLGSYDCIAQTANYQWYANLDGNDVSQVHRYLDLAPKTFPDCKGPIDIMAASAIRDLRSLNPNKPILLAESGAVEPSHSAPSKLYERDHEGTILHDVLFAAFFAGAAGPGQIWHWDLYLARHNLWWHYRAFAAVLEGIAIATEQFAPYFHEREGLRAYELRGINTRLFWLRDAKHDWRVELESEIPAPVREGETFAVEDNYVHNRWETLDPWNKELGWRPATGTSAQVNLPAWRRSLALRAQA